MWRIGIAGNFNDLFFRSAQERVQSDKVILEPFRDRTYYDAVVIMPDTDMSGKVIRCSILIVPEKTVLGESEAKSVVSYGMSSKNTVTMSSSREKQQVIALQRDVISLDASLVLRQEFAIDSDLAPYETLVLASLMIITGVLEQ